ncbi:putative interphotoreceptor retinol- binding protein (plasmid) [Phenylobacterium zucineum HLK1]|uniref:Putative interphotoreceptor retinol-binding protein n=1 Tax=Phenylobacterium zucineum (strain HLK1) TaxID=450851 RepID=B4RIS4_PHEZH|nr:S41 family peptidase [Phenylobacterium zucineum]ACG80249.1 putative interphotoreceptor retinol- binding protein [Phenylobacterium zucineum HLK1]
MRPAWSSRKVNDLVWRIAGTRTFRIDSFSTKIVPSSYLGRRVVILTSARTVSAGEELAYNMKVLGRATVIGETTKGGANPGGIERVGSRLVAFIPTGQARNPTTGTNWEGAGVAPDIHASAADALAVAMRELRVPNVRSKALGELTTEAVFRPAGH